MTHVSEFIRSVVPPCRYDIGDTVRIGRKLCRIVSGQYWGTYGLSNHWTWREILPTGKLGPSISGYGGDWPLIKRRKRR